MISPEDFPRLAPGRYRVTSPPTPDYNCVAWAAKVVGRWWQPGDFWPIEADRDDYGPEVLLRLFESLGYIGVEDPRPEEGFENVALYHDPPFYTHAARQLPSGAWTSKLGRGEDIEHATPEDLAGGLYGVVFAILKRREGPS